MLCGRGDRSPAVSAAVAASAVPSAVTAAAVAATSLAASLASATLTSASLAPSLSTAAVSASAVAAAVSAATLAASTVTTTVSSAVSSAISAADPVPAGVVLPVLSAGVGVRRDARRVRQLVDRDGRLPARGDVGSGCRAVRAVRCSSMHEAGAAGEPEQRLRSRR